MTDATIAAYIDAIDAEMRAKGPTVVAFSGGIDSAVVAALAQRALGDQAYAVTAVSETLASAELEEAQRVAAEIGIAHRCVAFRELDSAEFRANNAQRCFFCQSMRFDQLRAMADELGCAVLASGTNASDLGEHRPGLRAMRDRRIYQPLLEHRIDKQAVRAIGRALGLSIWDKPAQACLSSRIPHGLEVTEDRLRRIERAETVLEREGFAQARVRDHDGLARIEVRPDQLSALLADAARLSRIQVEVGEAGFEAVCVDMRGYRSGSLSAHLHRERSRQAMSAEVVIDVAGDQVGVLKEPGV